MWITTCPECFKSLKLKLETSRVMNPSMTKCSDNEEELMEYTDHLSVPGGTINNEEPECFFCGKRNSNEVLLELCQYCKDVYCCGPTHFEYHRPESQCFPYIVKHAPGVGR